MRKKQPSARCAAAVSTPAERRWESRPCGPRQRTQYSTAPIGRSCAPLVPKQKRLTPKGASLSASGDQRLADHYAAYARDADVGSMVVMVMVAAVRLVMVVMMVMAVSPTPVRQLDMPFGHILLCALWRTL